MAGIFDQITGQPAGDEPEDADSNTDVDPGETTGASLAEADRTDRALREAAQELLRLGLLEHTHRPNLYRTALVALDQLNAILEPLDLLARVDDIRGLVFLAVRHTTDSPQGAAAEQDDWSHPLVRKQRLNLEQTLLVAILRQHFIAYEQEAGSGATEAIVAVDELVPSLQLYLGDSGSEARERSRVLQLLDQLKGHGLVSAPDSHERVVIRPMIAHLANPENLTALLHALKQQVAEAARNQDGTGGER
ncbi:hypothetical protein S7S_05655 [Isoalcanivorax pacificus W11-5]|uniref:DUF4194 domain-containing protein n=1 Tax=Isoalcanivorax pacificus W11-5 TaxID=391936 RepID=A0A0B4XHD1_9GAMM|nr:DUF4194 domain-containing protein [Isoalcanivorax pacificus]AJD47549.1 hypothetical protein S7S_05655 [Isoalcanivorax pacificus W11-5]